MRLTSDKILLGVGAVLALVSAGIFGTMAWRAGDAANTPVPAAELSETPYTPTVAEAPPVKIDVLAAPAPQSRGREWLYDMFTPPEIYYNARTKQFTVRPPSSLVEEEVEVEFGLELVAVRPEPFRLQLIGFVGEGETARGMFENVLTGEVFLGAAGKHVAKLGVTVRSLNIQFENITLPQSMTTRQRVASAVVRDEKNGREITLTNRERKMTGTVSAFVAATGATATREVQAGDVFKLGEATYRVEKVQLTPPAIEITKQMPNVTQPDRRLLHPRDAETAETDAPPQPGG